MILCENRLSSHFLLKGRRVPDSMINLYVVGSISSRCYETNISYLWGYSNINIVMVNIFLIESWFGKTCSHYLNHLPLRTHLNWGYIVRAHVVLGQSIGPKYETGSFWLTFSSMPQRKIAYNPLVFTRGFFVIKNPWHSKYIVL